MWNTRTRFLLLVAFALLAMNLGRQGYRWIAYADEREELALLTTRLESAGLAVMQTQLLADSLRAGIEAADARLRQDRLALDRMERRAEGRGLPPALYDEYRYALERYNQQVLERNDRFQRWRGVVSRNHASVDLYNQLADSMRALGTRMGEPYLAIPSPAELAVRHGLGVAAPEEP